MQPGVNDLLEEAAQNWEITLAIKQLEPLEAIMADRPPLGGPLRWKITQAGKQIYAGSG